LASTQDAYNTSSNRLFAELDRLESVLSDGRQRILGGDSLSLVDIQVINCLVRFNPVYFDLFKCFRRRISSYKYLSKYARSVANELGENLPLDLHQIVQHYWTNFASCNPNGVVPLAYRDDFLDGGIEKYRDDGVEDSASGGEEQDQTNKKEQVARGEFVRGVAAHRNWLGDEQFPLEENRYILFVANNCPWCHRTMMARAMFPGMEKYVDASVMFYRRGGPDDNWRFLPADESEFRVFEKDHPELLVGIDKSDPTGNGCLYARKYCYFYWSSVLSF
jgi:glutathionyl-hydroquinone reductase